MRPLGSAEFDRRDLSGGNPVEMMLRRARSQGELSDDIVADCMARMQARMRIARRQAAHDDQRRMMTNSESGVDDVFSFSSTSPGADSEGEVDVRPSFDEGRTASPSVRVGPALTASGIILHAARGRVDYGRSALTNERIATHEGAHAAVGVALGSIISLCTIIPCGQYGGRTMRAGPKSERFPGAEADSPAKTTEEIVQLCDQLASMPPQFGQCRVADSEAIVRLQTSIVELLAGSEAERIFFPDLKPLDAKHDQAEAAALASAICATPDAVDALLGYCRSEARGLIKANSDIIAALADQLVSRGTLLAGDIEEIIGDAVAARSQNAEHEFA